MTTSLKLPLYRSTTASRNPHQAKLTTVVAITAAFALMLGVANGAAASTRTGFSEPYSGTPKYLKYAPTQAIRAAQLNQPLGAKAAARIARGLGLKRRDVFTAKQYRLFVSGKGHGGDPASAKLVDASVRILTNTTGRPLYSDVDGVRTATVLASYGLLVNTDGLLESPANSTAPTRKVNAVLVPGGYMGTWSRHNGAARSMRNLYRSAYTSEAVFGFKSQAAAGVAQLVPNLKGSISSTVGMSIAPSIWITNFALIYTLNPSLAAKMPARWVPIPANVASAIAVSPTGQVPYSEYASSFPASTAPNK